MSGPRVFEYAKEIGLETLQLMNKLRDWNIPVKNHMAELDEATITLIRSKFEEETKTKSAEGSKKKVAKKKVAAAAPKKEAASPGKKTTTRAAAGGAAKKTTSKKAASTVIRRKASEMAESREAAQEEVEEQPAPMPHEIQIPPADVPVVEEQAADGATAVASPSPQEDAVAVPVTAKRPPGKREVVVEPMQETRGKNIVGRMDLSRAVGPRPAGRPQQGGSYGGRPPQGQAGPGGQRFGYGSGTTVSSGAPRSRNIRTGFMATPAPAFEAPEDRFKKDERKFKPRPAGAVDEGVTKEGEEVPVFSAAEFRKREMIFQPRKKKGLLNRESLKTQITTPKASKRIVKIHDTIQVAEFAKAMGVKAGALITALMKNGMMVTQNDVLDFDTASLMATEFGYEVENVKKSVAEMVQTVAFGELDAELVRRAPIVTVMGHVDHGKTSLLDAIRKTDVAAGEAGGITQHIGAYSVMLEDGHTVTFIDTPGHAAFTAMRARGANVTDIAIIVVAADDGMMPQTAEAINHAKAAGVPIIVAINKMDKPGANPDRIKQQLTEFELVPEEWGGTTIYCPVSALKKTGIKELLEQVILTAEVADLKANPKRSGTGVVIEAKMEKGRGVVATILVKDGTVKQGQAIVAGTTFGRIRAMMDDRGQAAKEAGPSTPVEILGLQQVPAAGDKFNICETEKIAESVAQIHKGEIEKKEVTPNSKMSLEDLFSKVQTGDMKELPIILKTDVSGSSEAIVGMLEKEIKSDKVKVKIVHSAIGGINESDVLLASTSKGIVIGFNVRPDSGALNLAKREGVEIKTYTIIYELMDDLQKALEGLLAPQIVEKVTGHAAVRDTFTVPKVGTIAGCLVQDGKVVRSGLVRVLREGRIIYDGKVGSLKRFKDDAREVAAGFECGIGIENFNDIKVGDTIEAYEKESVAQTL